MTEWFEDFFDGMYAKVLGKVFDEERTMREVRLVKRLLGVRKGQRVLDIPCGMGRLTIPMAKMGLVVTGVDLTAKFLRRGRKEAKKEGLGIRFVRSDMREIDFEGEFDGAFNWFGSFGYFSDGDNLEFCKKVLRALKPGGRFLVEGINKSWLVSHFRGTSEQVIGGVRIHNRTSFDARTSRVTSAWTFARGRTKERRVSKMRIFNGAEIRALLRAAGFRDIRLYQGPPVGRFTRHSRRLLAVGRRPKR